MRCGGGAAAVGRAVGGGGWCAGRLPVRALLGVRAAWAGAGAVRARAPAGSAAVVAKRAMAVFSADGV